jgi:hypothetical protein
MHNRIFSLILATSQADQTKPSGMVFASWAIIIVLLAIGFVFLRSDKKEYSIAVMPLIITPFIYIFSGIIAKMLAGLIHYPIPEIRVVITLTGGLLSCLLLGPASRRLEGPRTRLVFFLSCAAFLIILTIVFVVNILNFSKV